MASSGCGCLRFRNLSSRGVLEPWRLNVERVCALPYGELCCFHLLTHQALSYQHGRKTPGQLPGFVRMRRQVRYYSSGVAALVLMNVTQAFIGLPVRIPMPGWFSVLLAAYLGGESFILGGWAIRYINVFSMFKI